MSPILPKHLMTEEDIKLNYITPALVLKGWQDRITMETAVKFTDGKVNLKGNITVREAPKKADYLLYVRANQPIAVVEAKDNSHSVTYGLRQDIMNIAAEKQIAAKKTVIDRGVSQRLFK